MKNASLLAGAIFATLATFEPVRADEGARWAACDAASVVANDETKTESYVSQWVKVSGANADKIGAECDAIIERLTERYGAPRTWTRFPVIFTGGGGSVAGYTSYAGGVVREVVVYQSFDVARGGTLDHELTHAFFFYWLDANFDLFLNEGAAQNSEYRRRESLRRTVYSRYRNGDFVPIDKLYGRNSYDGSLLIYHQGFSVVDFLIARGGSKWFAAFLDDLTRGTRDINKALNGFYGYGDLKELEADWLDYVEGGQDRAATRNVLE